MENTRYTVGWIAPLPLELTAARAALDHEYGNIQTPELSYLGGKIGAHDVVIGVQSQMGTDAASVLAVKMQHSFPNIKFFLVVGIGGGVPRYGPTGATSEIVLGDVVVSSPRGNFGGVVRYDTGAWEGVNDCRLNNVGHTNGPPAQLLTAINQLQSNHATGAGSIIPKLLSGMRLKIHEDERYKFEDQGPDQDRLFDDSFQHPKDSQNIDCQQCCNLQLSQQRQLRGSSAVRKTDTPKIHYGNIASSNQLQLSTADRNRLQKTCEVICFEMEGAGVMHIYPCLIIRGICDYADSHKNKKWQAYAAGTAAAYAKEVLSVIPAAEVMKMHSAEEAVRGASKSGSRSQSFESVPAKRRKIDFSISPENGIAEQQTVPLPVHHQGQSQPLLNEEQKQNLLDSLRFDQLDARQMTIKTAHAKTCKWLLKNPQYLEWLDATKLGEHHGFLWIKGKAGAGKSTLMKFATINARKTIKDRITLSFFFNARGEDIEKSTIGTYRSLLLQLLERLPALQSVFDSLGLATSTLSADHRWNIESLQMLLEQAVCALGETFVVCFIDALDECEEKQVRDMIQFFERVGDLAVANRIRFQVCFSSRHYPHITIRNGLELILEGQEGHTQDITNYVETELKIGKSKTAQQIRVDLQEKASGIFMWVVLVVGILNKESDRGQVHALRRKLQEIPSDLHELFRDILTRDSHNRYGLVLCIQWVLFSRQPLSPEQLYYAILSGICPDAVSEWDPREITKDVIKRFILDSSKGLAEATVSKEQKVQFIHESVRDFLLKENGLSKIWPEFGRNFQGQSHEQLKQCCLNYIGMDVATPLKISNSLPKASSQQAAEMRKLAVQKFPFLEYAVRNMLYHANTAEGGGISQAHFLNSFPSPKWVELDNLFEKHEVRRHTKRVSCLYLLAEFNMANLIKVLSSADQCMRVEDERYGCPLFAATATGSEEALELCMKSVRVDQATERFLGARNEYKSQLEPAQGGARRDFSYSKTKGFLICAVELGHDGVLSLGINSGRFKIDSKDSKGRSVLWWASKHGCETAARSILDAGSVEVNSKDKDKKTPLYVAAEEGNKSVVGLLLEKGANVDVQGGHYGNALQAASARGHKEVATLLLEKGADVNAQGGYYGNALQAALARGHKEVATLLLEKGADVNAQGGYYGNALQAASAEGYKEVAILLLEKGANVNTQGGDYRNALQAASARGHKEVATLLLEKGADVNAQGGHYGNALQAASAEGHKEVAMLLLEKGANANAQGGYYGNALQAALTRGHKEVAMLLLEKGADVNAQGGHYDNALQAASARGYKEVAMLLLEKGADINAQGGHYGNALQAASARGHKEVAMLLLEKGANVNTQGGDYRNALQAASARGHKEVAMLLLEKGAVR